MRAKYNRKQSPKVVGGQVLRKNNHIKTSKLGYIVDRVRPGKGYKHVVRKKEIHDFIDLIPNWESICKDVESIILDAGDEWADGYYQHQQSEGTGIIWITAWKDELWRELSDEYFIEHKWLLDRLEVINERLVDVVDETQEEIISWRCYFNEAQAKAFTLMHVFLHELGHHVDKMRSKKQDTCKGGENFAEGFANKLFNQIWPSYLQRFGDLY